MTYLVHILDKDGNFELIDKDFLNLYPDLERDDDGNIVGLVELSDEQYQEFCQRDNGKTKFINGQFVFTAPTDTDHAKLLERIKQDLVQKIADKTDLIKSQILVGYPQAEIDSFYRQEKEALAYQADPQADVPMLRAIAAQREMPLDELVEKVLAKAALFAAVMGGIIGQRQALEDHILMAKNQAELTACEQEIEQWQPNQ